MIRKDVLPFQQAVDDTHVTDFVGFSWIHEDVFTSAALSTALVNEGSKLSSIMNLSVMFIQVGPAAELFLLLTKAAT